MITVIEGPETQFGTQTLQGVFTVKDLKDLIESFYGKTVKRFNKVVRDTFSNLDTRSTLIREAKNNPSNPILSGWWWVIIILLIDLFLKSWVKICVQLSLQETHDRPVSIIEIPSSSSKIYAFTWEIIEGNKSLTQ